MTNRFKVDGAVFGCESKRGAVGVREAVSMRAREGSVREAVSMRECESKREAVVELGNL